MIKVDNLNKYYNKNKTNEIHVINDVTLELPNQGLVSFLGASGSGKTTLLNVIGGLDKGQGIISYDSFEMKKYEMSKIDKYRNENFGYVFQTYNLLLNETVYDNLKIALELIDIYDEKEASSRIEYALKSVGMYKYRKKRASQLSGGQQQRVAIARALVKHCKVIIADEPTGNLDSANAVEVMNILKSISKKTLVLLVTHNESLANFYSNYIYRIEDGKIISKYENLSNETLNTSNDNVIYLKDMNLSEGKVDSVGIKFYSNESKDIELEIVERNNTFYIRSNKNIKLLENSNIKLVDEHYKPVEKFSVKEYDYDNSFFNNSVKKRNIFQDFLTNLKHSFLSFIKPTKKIKVIYISLALIGILFSICSVSIANAVKVDTTTINADEHYSTINKGGYGWSDEDSSIMKTNIKDGNISSIQILTERYFDFSYKINYVESIVYSENLTRLYFNEKVNKILYGRAPVEHEVAISKKMADVLLEEFSSCCNTYEDLFNLSISNISSKLVGIVECDEKMAYISEQAYVEEITSHIYIENDGVRYYEVEKQNNTYEIVMGRDLNEGDFNTDRILISDKFVGHEQLVDTDILGVGYVVGVYKMKDVEYSSYEVIANIPYIEKIYASYKYSYSVEDYVLVEGRHPEKENELLISTYSSKQIGDTFDGYTIVGRYNARLQVVKAGTLLSTSVISIQDYVEKVFIIENSEGVLNSISDSNFELRSMYQFRYDNLKETNDKQMTVFGLLGGVCLIATSIMIFFLMRSKMINDIYNIGVYRSLGSSKLKIYLKYFTDTIVMVTFTSLISYIIIMFCYLSAIDSINDYYGTELFNRGLGVPLLGILVLYLINLVFGLLPIFTLLRKTPSEILVKYDI